MAKYKSKYKGVRYVTAKLLKYYPKRYPNKSEASKEAHAIVSKLKLEKTKVTLKSVFSLLPKKVLKSSKREVPVLDTRLTDVSNYFTLEDYVLYIESTSSVPSLRFVSNIIPDGLEPIFAGFEYSYSDYFAPFVNYIDKLRTKEKNPSMYSVEWYVKCEKPVYNNDKKYFESKIISCDSDGTENDYGFDKKNPNVDVTDYNNEVKPANKYISKKDTPTVPNEESVKKDIDKQIELTNKQIELAKEIKELLKSGMPYSDIKKLFNI